MPTTGPKPISGGPQSLSRSPDTRSPFRSLLQQAYQCLAVVSLAALSYFIFSHFLLQSVKVVGRSMVPTLADSQHYILNRWIYHFRAPRASDIVVLRDPSDNGFSVKRIVAIPGDAIFLKDGNVFVNGCKLNEPYLIPGTPTFTDSKYRKQFILCGKDQFFVLGDNRLNSIDSRMYGPVPRKNILGSLMW